MEIGLVISLVIALIYLILLLIFPEEIDDVDKEILEDDTLTEEIIEDEIVELTEEEIAAIEAEIKAEEERLIQEQT